MALEVYLESVSVETTARLVLTQILLDLLGDFGRDSPPALLQWRVGSKCFG